ncbi:NPCBM/NEW2 domain-containing protein [Haloferula sp. BvORR071]|uniref:NPCBM/NEW2 domain-containing protein n=1 Tax=Haloferula sp. BvORR071 TaxID=1396141 RepID=UPI0005500254|nr:NPCBM/NEW2 domain-containing protein [Haloferula sp. BvORR071]
MKASCFSNPLPLACALIAAAIASIQAAPQETRLSDLDLSGMSSGWQKPTADAEVNSSVPLAVGSVDYDFGIGTHADSTWKLILGGKGVEFRSKVGVQDASPGKVEFIVRGDGKDLFRSGPMSGGEAAKEIKVSLAGVQTLELLVDSLGSTTSDHADWLEPVLVHDGAALPPLVRKPAEQEVLVADLPGDPPNAGLTANWSNGSLILSYEGKELFSGKASAAGAIEFKQEVHQKRQAVTQELILRGTGIKLSGVVTASREALAAETEGAAQKRFPLIRTSIGGPSQSLRNNAVYERGRDWMLEAPATDATRIVGAKDSALGRAFTLEASGDEIRLVFRPRFYQRHKNIAHFRPWTYQIRKDSITGWSSWWAYMRNFSQKDCDELLAVWKEKQFADYGYRFIQIDDCFQNEFGKGQARQAYPGANTGYVARGPETWLDWRKDLYPAGLTGYADACRKAGFEPGVWIGSYFTDNELITQHPDWFIQGQDGKPFVAPWASCGIDATNKTAMDTLVRPTFRGLRKANVSYVKVDLLRHYLYDNLHHNLEYCKAHGVAPDQMYRKYLGAIREELGPDTFLLSCWGVLPESVGIADACRIGGDGYGPMTMQQYNSWNGIVWRNDPDHCDVFPHFKPAEAGNVTKTTTVQASPTDTIIRPALASIASCMLLLSDRPQVYRDEANLRGLRRAAPVLFSVPGQLYDFTPDRSRNLIRIPRTAITNGADPSPIDALQFGTINPWWLNEYNLPGGSWVVLNRINWSNQAAAKTSVALADIGLDPKKQYVAYEFWSNRYLGSCKDSSLVFDELPAMGLSSIAIRELSERPQLVSTNRHLSQGGVDLVSVAWSQKVLSGKSRVVAGDRYEISVRVPAGYQLKAATIDGKTAAINTEGELVRIACVPATSSEVAWQLEFDSK